MTPAAFTVTFGAKVIAGLIIVIAPVVGGDWMPTFSIV
jgi:hypothetical protein